jgi:hypothetical protein
MQRRWLNDKQPDENGDYILVIENAKGARVSTFKGKTIDEVAEKLADSQIHVNMEFTKLRKPDAARPQLKIEPPKQLTAADRLRLSSDITDPERVVEAIEEIVTARQGISPDNIGRKFTEMSQQERDAYYIAESSAFREEHPEFYPVPQNRDALFGELRANGWDLTRNNLAIAFTNLWDRGDMIAWPDDSGENPPPSNEDDGTPNAPPATPPNGRPTPAVAAPSPRPRTVATGLRNADASANAPVAPRQKTPRYTRAEIEGMSQGEFKDKLLNEPGFRDWYNSNSKTA